MPAEASRQKSQDRQQGPSCIGPIIWHVVMPLLCIPRSTPTPPATFNSAYKAVTASSGAGHVHPQQRILNYVVIRAVPISSFYLVTWPYVIFGDLTRPEQFLPFRWVTEWGMVYFWNNSFVTEAYWFRFQKCTNLYVNLIARCGQRGFHLRPWYLTGLEWIGFDEIAVHDLAVWERQRQQQLSYFCKQTCDEY